MLPRRPHLPNPSTTLDAFAFDAPLLRLPLCSIFGSREAGRLLKNSTAHPLPPLVASEQVHSPKPAPRLHALLALTQSPLLNTTLSVDAPQAFPTVPQKCSLQHRVPVPSATPTRFPHQHRYLAMCLDPRARLPPHVLSTPT